MTSPTSAALACPSCGVGVLPGDRFCPACGASLGTSGGTTTLTSSPWDAVLRRLRAGTIGEFDIKRELGRGGMAAVYLAHDIALDLKVALKVMAPGIMMGEGMIERFRQEAITVANLSHPNIVRVYARRQLGDDLHFIVMQYVAGRTLERVIHEVGTISIPVARTILDQVARALAHAHKRGVVHRDIKPGNIMLDASGDVVVTDFGIAKASTAQSHTVTGSVVGTPAYMSPEQCFAQPLTGASDQYSLGVVAFEMLTGRVPFSGPPYAVMHGHTHGEIPAIRTVRPDCPPELEALVARMLAKAPDDRFASMSEVVDALNAPRLSDHDPLRETLIRLAAVEEAAALDALYPTPVSPVPRTRASVAPLPAAPGGPRTPTPPLVEPDPAPVAPLSLAPAVPTPPARTAPLPAAPSPGRPKRVAVWAVPAVVVVTGAVLALARPWDSADRVGRSDSASVGDSAVGGQPGGRDSTNARPPAPTLRIADVPLTVTVGDTFRLGAIFTGPDSVAALPNVWRSRAPAVIRVDSAGRGRALRPGLTVVALTRGALSDSVALRVLPAAPPEPPAVTPTRIAIVGPSGRLRVNDRVTLRADEMDAAGNRQRTATGVSWSSSDPTVASVDPRTGELVARTAGNATISARTARAQTTFAVSVDAPPPPPPEPPTRHDSTPVVTRPPVEPPRDRPPPAKTPAELRAELEGAVQAYARAIESMDPARLRAAYPGISSAQLDAFRTFFDAARDIKITIDRIDAPPQLSATVGAEVRSRVAYRIEYYNTSLRRTARESAQWEALLARTATGWRISSIR